MSGALVRVESVGDGVAEITLDRPDRRNAINGELASGLARAIDAVEEDATVRVAILTGAGRMFSAGMDLAAFAAGEPVGLHDPDGFCGLVARIRRKPLIAAVNGGALAGGFELMLACDLAIAAEDAVFGLPEVKVGVMPAGGGVFRLVRRLPSAIALELVLTGGTIDAARAASLGLLNAVVPAGELLVAARALAARIAANAPLAVSRALALAQAAERASEDALWTANNRFWREIARSHDAREGASAFVGKRPPIWRGD